MNLAGSELNLSGTRAENLGDTITLINNDGTDPIIGTFAGLREGSFVTLNGVTYMLSYHGGDGNDVTLTDSAAAFVTGAETVTAIEGSDSGDQTLATFTNPGGSTDPADYSAAVDWGDGSSADSGTISYDSGTSTFTVIGSHTYSLSDTYDISIVVTPTGASPAAAVESTAIVSLTAPAALTVTEYSASDVTLGWTGTGKGDIPECHSVST